MHSVEFVCERCGRLIAAVVRPTGSDEEERAILWTLRHVMLYCLTCRRVVFLEAERTEAVDVPSCIRKAGLG
jgi:hypothetical protein